MIVFELHKIVIISFFICICALSSFAQNPSAIVEYESTSQGVLIPRMTLIQRTAIDSPAIGLLVYQTDSLDGFYFYNGAAWQAISTGSGGTDTDQQMLFLNGDTLQLSAGISGGGGVVDLSAFMDNTDLQILTLDTSTMQLSISNGNSIDLSIMMDDGDIKTMITDNDRDTKIQVEESADEDVIRFDIQGSEMMVLTKNDIGAPRLELIDTITRSTTVGMYALYSNMTGYSNSAFGYEALRANTAGDDNSAFGEEALRANTTGDDNSAFGEEALRANTTGDDNSAFGEDALRANTTGSYNSAFGEDALYFNTTGSNNSAFGEDALRYSTEGHSNSAFGEAALRSNTSGSANIAIGVKALYNNSIRSYLVAIGDSALYNNGLGTTSILHAKANTAVGSKSLYDNTIGYNNTALGYESLKDNDSGHQNTAIGTVALTQNTIGERNTAVGNKAMYRNTTGSKNVAVGHFALYHNTSGSNRTAVGFNANNGLDWSNTTALGANTQCTAEDQVRIGNSDVGSIGGYANWTTLPCDRRFKKNVSDTEIPGLTFINLLRPVAYSVDKQAMNSWWADNYNFPDSVKYTDKQGKENTRYTGFIAQEVEAAAQSVNYDFSGVDAPKNGKDFYGLRYATFVVPLVKAVQELSINNEQLTMSNEQFKKENEALKTRIQQIEMRMAIIEELLNIAIVKDK